MIVTYLCWTMNHNGNNFVKTMLCLAETRDELSVVADQIGSPTNAADLAKAILMVLPQIENTSPEIYHYSNQGVCSWYDFAQAIFELSKLQTLVKAIETVKYPTPAKRPEVSVLNKKKIKTAYGLKIESWYLSLIKTLNS